MSSLSPLHFQTPKLIGMGTGHPQLHLFSPEVCAETHCSMLLKKGSVFEKCHSVVNPQPFYKRCVYQACNYEETFPHICSALGAYAHACSARGILLWGWRNSVDNCSEC